MESFRQSSSQTWVAGPVLGRGATATVSLATFPLTGDVFAVKSADLPRSSPLQRERRFLTFVGNSPHIISYLGAHATPSSYNLLLEYAPGGSLADEIMRCGKEEGVGECRIRRYARDILMGLRHLHARGIAHCDVKPRNVLLTADGAAKLADLGCARWIDGKEEEEEDEDDCWSSKSDFKGTPMFMAPEVARGEGQGSKADIWALGCTVVEMATGRPPWPDATNLVSTVHRIAFSADVPETPKGLLSDEAREFLELCLKRDPRERWSADRLLKHPFIAAAGEEGSEGRQDCSGSCNFKPNWQSPKCVLDQDDVWGSLGEDEEEEPDTMMMDAKQEEEHDGAAQRLRLLALPSTSLAAMPDWGWGDGDWVTVRSGCGDESDAADCSTSSTEESTQETDCFDGSGTSSRVLTPSPAECFSAPPSSTTTTTKDESVNSVPFGSGDSIVPSGDDCDHSTCNSGRGGPARSAVGRRACVSHQHKEMYLLYSLPLTDK